VNGIAVKRPAPVFDGQFLLAVVAFLAEPAAMVLRPSLVALTGFILGATGCRPIDACAEKGTPCGGDPVGKWTLAQACQDPAFKIPPQRPYLDQPVTTARQPPPEPVGTDWCADLKYTSSGIEALNLPHDTFTLVGAYLVYGEDHTYSATVTSSAKTHIEFSRSCLTRFGFFPSDLCAEFASAFARYGATLGGVKDTSCEDSANGCLCTYTVESDAAGSNLNGTWSTNGGVLTHFAGTAVLPSQVDFCSDGDHLTLWGYHRTNIMDIAGARTMSLARIVCGNGKAERGEDCDPPDGTTCDGTCHAIMKP
jgi:hypothetical protein